MHEIDPKYGGASKWYNPRPIICKCAFSGIQYSALCDFAETDAQFLENNIIW
jgi:hypothetical protein